MKFRSTGCSNNMFVKLFPKVARLFFNFQVERQECNMDCLEFFVFQIRCLAYVMFSFDNRCQRFYSLNTLLCRCLVTAKTPSTCLPARYISKIDKDLTASRKNINHAEAEVVKKARNLLQLTRKL